MGLTIKKELFDKEYEVIQKRIEIIKKETDYTVLTDVQLANRYKFLRAATDRNANVPSHQIRVWQDSDTNFIAEALVVVEEIVYRTTKLRPFPTQRKAAYALYSGHIIDMKTGEGKTLAGLMCACLHNLFNEKVFIVSANEYLAKRDEKFSKSTYDFIGLTSAYIDPAIKENNIKREMYNCNVIYANNRTLVSDFIKSLNAKNKEEIFMPKLVAKGSKYVMEDSIAIVDEIDYILLDEGKNFFTQSKEISSNEEVLKKAFGLAKTFDNLMFYKDEELHNFHLTEEGISAACEFYEIDRNTYFSIEYKDVRKAILKSLDAIWRYKKDRDYIVKDDRVYTINSETGRINEFSRLTDGVHQLIEVKEGVPIRNDIKANCGVTYPDFYSRFKSFSGMSGTIITESKEINKLYKKQIIEIEPNIPSQRVDREDVVCKNKKNKDKNIVDTVVEANKKGQPVLLVVSNYEEGKHLQQKLFKKDINAELLTAKNHEEEALILAKSGIHGAVTITTIMAGRGVDIVPDKKAEEAGGLLVIGDGHFYSKRVDNQLRGRTGRQGANGETVFFIYLGDEISASYADKLGSLSIIEKSLKQTFKMEDDKESFGSQQIKRMYNEAQREKEYKDYETRCLFMELFSILSSEYINLYAQKNEYLLSTNEEKLNILNRMNTIVSGDIAKRKKKYTEGTILKPVDDSTFATSVIDKWEYFFDEDRFKQRLKLNSSVLSDNFIAQYSYDNQKRWHSLLTDIRKEVLRGGA